MSETLYFNGINGTTGNYGIPPMTLQEFVSHILEDHFAEACRLRELSDELARRQANAHKVTELVKVLAASALEEFEKPAPSHQQWLEQLAPHLVEILLEGQPVRTGDEQALARHLKAQPVETLEQIVKDLNRGHGASLARLLLAEEPDNTGTLQRVLEEDVLGTVEWVDPTQLGEAGWGVIFPATLPEARQQALLAALDPLLQWREGQAAPHYRVFSGKDGYRPGETAAAFLDRHGARAEDPANPAETGVPYYLLLVGTPEEIPFWFQYQLDVQYAVGRLDFGEDLAAYTHYANNVVAAEHAPAVPQPTAYFWGPSHDCATELSAQYLIAPLHEHMQERLAATPWQVKSLVGEDATKDSLRTLLTTMPTFLFTASHGLEYDCGHPLQHDYQGALVCQERAGAQGEVSTSQYFAAEDVDATVDLSGTLAFFFACFGAGTPRYDQFYRRKFKQEGEMLTETPFVAALPRAMLGLRDKGALAVVGHVDRAWSLSFLAPQAGTQDVDSMNEHVGVFASAIERLLAGHPVGSALDYFNMRYAAVATQLADLYDQIPEQPTPRQRYQLAGLWTANNDARGYVILGDPAVRLAAKKVTEQGEEGDL